jgi:hypothetical protein
MKKFAIISLAALLVVAFTMPAAAFENIFGGYWRTRAYHNEDFNGRDDNDNAPDGDRSLVDTRTRLYYTAKFSDNFKFVNKFEMDATWGDADSSGYGDIGADGISVEVKNSYVDFDMGALNSKIGVQGFVLARGFIADDDFSGIVETYSNDAMSLSGYWLKAYEGGDEQNTQDVDIYGAVADFKIGDAVNLKPYVNYWYSDNLDGYAASGRTNFPSFNSTVDEFQAYFVGLDADITLDMASFWLTGIYEGGKINLTAADGGDQDIQGYLVAGGAGFNFGPADIHAEAFYASGDDDPADGDLDAFFVPEGQSYYWSEIMGYGIFDFYTSAGSPADQIGNLWAVNLGATFKPVEKLSITGDVWYAEKAEDDPDTNEKELGTEVDLKVTYQLMDNLSLDVVGAYLFADDGTSLDGDNKDDPYEIGTRLSLSF